jgi:hypothetical protein
MVRKLIISVIAVANGGWMLSDGFHVLVTGEYFGPAKPGPWADLAAAVGLNPYGFGPFFVVLGVLWILFLVEVLRGSLWGWWGALVVAVLTLWYVPVGAALAVGYIVLLIFFKLRLTEK